MLIWVKACIVGVSDCLLDYSRPKQSHDQDPRLKSSVCKFVFVDLETVADPSARRAGPPSAHIWPWPAVLTVILYRSTDTKQLEAVLVRLLDAWRGRGREARRRTCTASDKDRRGNGRNCNTRRVTQTRPRTYRPITAAVHTQTDLQRPARTHRMHC